MPASCLPTTWALVTVGSVADLLAGYGFPKDMQGRQDGELPFYKVGDISRAWQAGSVQLQSAEHYLTEAEAKSIRAKPFPPSTTVFAKIGAAIALNRRAMLSVPSLVDNNVMGLRPREGVVDPKYLFHYACTLRLDEISRATTVPSVRKSDVSDIPFPLPPPAEQRRIVAKIEELCSKLDAGVAALERVRANLKRYRASLLKAAVEGKLTEQWRADHPVAEPASELLKQILTERRRQWEETELAKYAAKGQTPPTGWQAKYKEPEAPDTAELPDLPNGWCWATLDAIAAIMGGITKGQRRKSGTKLREVAYLRVANVQRGYLDLTELKAIAAEEGEINALRLRDGDVLFNEGGDRDKLGRGWVWHDEVEECIHQNHVFRARLLIEGVHPEFVSTQANTSGQQWFSKHGTQSVNLASINMTTLKRFPVALPPAEEQKQIMDEVEQRLSVLDVMKAEAETGLRRAARLRQAILKKAFEGRLVPQDPNDEPASAVLGHTDT